MTIQCSVFIATSVDGFIARPDGDVAWLEDPAYALADEADFGYNEFIAEIDTLVMGRRSFEKVQEFDEWYYGDLPVVVLSSRDPAIPPELADRVRCRNLAPRQLVDQLQAEGRRHLYIDGGDTIRRFLREGLIDDITITQIPILLGEGIDLFGTPGLEIPLKHERTKTYANGFIQTTYRITR